MRLGLVTDSLSHLPFEQMLDTCAELGITDVEFPVGGWSTAPHCDAEALLADDRALRSFAAAIERRGLRISAFNANGNQLHPVSGAEGDAVVRRAVELAHRLGVETVVCMSGLPGGAPGDRTPNWVTTSWPPETLEILDYQWNRVALPYWEDLARLGRARGVRFAVEMHGSQLVHSARTLLRLREAVGSVVGANVDPSHPLWQGADPRILVRELDGAVHHVHAKDVRMNPRVLDAQGVLDTTPVDLPDERAWNFVTLGSGHPGGATFWGQLFSDLRGAGYDGVLSIEHEDLRIDAVEGVRRTVRLLEDVIPRAAPSWTPADV
jgi:sugar phosphate isomerase/epimerase